MSLRFGLLGSESGAIEKKERRGREEDLRRGIKFWVLCSLTRPVTHPIDMVIKRRGYEAVTLVQPGVG